MSDKRERLFRAKHVHILPQNERFDGIWVYGYLCDRYCINSIYVDGYGERYIGENLIDPDTICEYTGLNDHTKWEQLSESEQERFLSGWDLKENRKNTEEDWNGRKIFEGDIIPDHFNRSIVGVVRYGVYRNPFNDDGHAGHVGFYVDWGREKDRLRADLGYWVKVSEVIGNIYDNPEMIEGWG